MEFLRISDSKLKISLQAEDLQRYHMQAEGLNYESAEARRVFWQLLDEAKQHCGFDTGGDKVLIQYYPLQSGGCELFVTKLGLVSESTRRSLCRSDRVTVLSARRGYYRFLTADALLDALAALRPLGETGWIRVGDDGLYYLEVEGSGGRGGRPDRHLLLGEYGCALPSSAGAYLDEHACASVAMPTAPRPRPRVRRRD